MSLAEYMIVAQGDEWGVHHDGKHQYSLCYQGECFRGSSRGCVVGYREGHEVHLSVPDHSAGNQTARDAKTDV
jgi:hypothetical protein